MTATARLAHQLVQAAMRLHAKQLWNEFDDDDAVVLEIPHHEEPLAACICGQSGEEFGLVLFRDGLPGMDRMFTSAHVEDSFDAIDQLSLLVSPLRDIPPPLRGLLEEARWRGRRESFAPHLMVKRPGMQPRNPRKGEMRTMLYAVSAILAAHEAGDLVACTYDAPDGVQLLRLSGTPQAPTYEIDETVFDGPDPRELTVSLQLADADYRRDDRTWSVGVFSLPAFIENDDRTLRSLIVLESGAGKVIHQDAILGNEMETAAASLLRFAAEGGLLPREISCLNRDLHELLHSAFAAHGVQCLHEPDQPDLEKVAALLSDHLEGMHDSPDDAETEEWLRWQRPHNDFIEAVAELAHQRNPDRNRTLARYFGSARRGGELMAAYDDDFLALPFAVWRLLLYRPRSGSKTFLEQTLKRRDLPPEQRAVGEAMQAASPSIYRVESVDAPHLALLDIVGGGHVEVRDTSLARTAREGSLLPAIVFPVGSYTSLALIGPSVPPMQAGDAFRHLESQGIEMTAAGLAAHSHFGGRLTEWMDRNPLRMPQIVTTDGEEIVMHTADFEMDDPRAAVEALAARPDIDYDEREANYAWLGDEGSGGRPGRILLGRIEVLDNHLVLECNSVERFERARSFLQNIPGVRFVSARTEEMDFAANKDATPPDDLPGIDEQGTGASALDQNNLPPEVVEQMRAMFAEMQMSWLDTEIPAFGGKTPRAMCATPEGRREITLQIRTMPKPHPSITVEQHDQIRDDMLRELDLDTREI